MIGDHDTRVAVDRAMDGFPIWQRGVVRLSEHFVAPEFGGPVSVRLVRHLEALRYIVGDRPLHIVSGYRSPAHNAEVGGAPKSQHLVGLAADIPEGYATYAQALMAGFTGIGTHAQWALHVDVRRGPDAHWTYPPR